MKSNKYKRIWVSEDFASQCKINAAKEKKSIAEYTKNLSKKLEEEEKPTKKKGYGWSL